MVDRRVESDLDWYFNCSDGELSAPSNFSAMVTVITVGYSAHRQPASDVSVGRLEAAALARSISRALQQLTALDRRVLRVVFGPSALDLPILGRTAPLAPATLVAQAAYAESRTTRSMEDWLVRLTWRASQRVGDRVAEDSATAHAIAAETYGLLSKALRAFDDIERPSRRGSPHARAA